MFCNQCEQARQGIGCAEVGVCGKNADIQSLQETLLYGVKGMAAYAHHARRLGATDEGVNAFIEEALFATLTNVNFDVQSHIELVLECGRQNLRVMEMLDAAHTARLGTPTPVEVWEGTKPGPGILVTGHDMLDLADLLEQAAGTGVNVYTHGEMLPAHMYPKLRAHAYLAGHVGGGWQNQRTEFHEFTGPVLATTNCILVPRNGYGSRVFTTRVTAVPGGTRIAGNDFRPLIRRALECPPLTEKLVRRSTIGFHHSVILGLAGQIVEAVKAGIIRHVFLVGGCDGAEPGRNYFSEFAAATPADTLVLTLGCGKYRIRNHEYGTITLPGGVQVPRLLDMGQCNDAYGAITVASALAKAFGCTVNDLPLTIVLSWFEQKAVSVLLTLLALGVKGIRIGPAAPAFVSPGVFGVLQDRFDLGLIGSDPIADVQAALGQPAGA